MVGVSKSKVKLSVEGRTDGRTDRRTAGKRLRTRNNYFY